jgi:hypothetical protein
MLQATLEAIHELGLAEGSAVTAIVKASDVILAVDDQGGYVGPSVAQRAAREGGVPRRAHALIRGALPA